MTTVQGQGHERDLLLPERTRLIHIGLPKSGSSTIQEAASALRPQLRKAGVLYPGNEVNHIRAAGWLIGEPVPFTADPGPRPEWWDSVRRQIEDADDKRILFSNERISWADIDAARNVVDSLGQPAHGLLVLRNLGSYAPSAWQQNLKTGNLQGLDEYLRRAFSDPTGAAVGPPFHRRDGLGLVERWVEALGGPENLTVVVLEKEDPDRLLATLEQLLGLPDRMLVNSPVPEDGANRGLSTAEAALVMALNRRVQTEWGVHRHKAIDLVFRGAAMRLLGARTPGPGEEKILAPRWAVEAAAEVGGQLADSVRESGIRVIGDLGELTRVGPSSEADPTELPAMIPSDVALEALSGMFAVATGWNWRHTRRRAEKKSARKQAAKEAAQETRPVEPPAPVPVPTSAPVPAATSAQTPEEVLGAVPARTLVATLARRAAQRARQVVAPR
ncbi:hypothetical protein [Myceligenerans crystallogenes]|uniref:Sulfotransferase family protein n=1 Tax=Myceligenerans crystallogenes TaxID=316335 RepID=A0ABP4ZPN0_9MICO